MTMKMSSHNLLSHVFELVQKQRQRTGYLTFRGPTIATHATCVAIFFIVIFE
ncbi:hypothetical protein KIN20_036644 [Parelaphostrongylus tenuis]|uniref:Uncharacterized protein n=1 Tax=Parelaphostrongylus tenuis TaxID=148309 RepID=A0AAD5RDP4_PARTN|nr:hypothetical protein KIN20_036644 [Parelaphostrongylus tenuis]